MLAVQVQYRDVLEKERHNRATERQARSELEENRRHNITTEWETERSHKAGENISLLNLQETSRHNVAVENEAYRHNVAYEEETRRHNVVGENETQRHNLASEALQSQQVAAQKMQAQASLQQAAAAEQQAKTAAARASYENYLTFQKTQTEKARTDEAKWNAQEAYNTSRISGVKAEYSQIDSFTNLFTKFIPLANLAGK